MLFHGSSGLHPWIMVKTGNGFLFTILFMGILLKQCGHGHDVRSFSCHTVITSRFPCFISHTYNGRFCEVSHSSLFLKFCYVLLVRMIFIALNCKFCYMTFVQVKHFYTKIHCKWVEPRNNVLLKLHYSGVH